MQQQGSTATMIISYTNYRVYRVCSLAHARVCACMHVFDVWVWCECVCMHECVSMHKCVCMCACVREYAHHMCLMHVSAFMCLWLCVHACMHVCACMHACIKQGTYQFMLQSLSDTNNGRVI